MFIAQIIQLVRRQSKTIIPLTPISPLILGPQAPKQNGAADARQHVEREADAEPGRVPGRFGRDEHVRGHERGAVPAADLERGADDALVSRAQVVHVPHHQYGHHDVYPRGDGEEAEIAGYHRVGLGQFDDPSDHGQGHAQHRESVPVGYPVAEPCHGDGQCEGDHEDRDRVYLGLRRCIAELFEDRGLEGHDC